MYRKYFKRLFDMLFSIVGLFFLSPILIFISVLILFFSGRPVFFIQNRLGIHGKKFQMYKFRSMKVDSEFSGNGVYSDLSDPRLTKFGKFLRITSLDELPQMLNILRGEMSFIGPRPPLTYHPWKLSDYTQEQLRMFEVRPGITGWAQVNGRKQLDWPERIQMNIWYVDHLSFALDCKIMMKTLVTLFRFCDNINSRPTVISK